MRFSRSDLPGLAIALLAGPALMLLFLASGEAWGHRGTPLLGFAATNIGVAAGVAAVGSRFIRRWDAPLAAIGVIVAVAAAVNWLQASGLDGTRFATGVKWIGLAAFAALNAAVLLQLARHGLLPLLDRLDARREAKQAVER